MQDKNELAIARANRIKELATGEGGLFDIIDAVERHYTNTWAGSDVEDHAVREASYHRINALRDIRIAMKAVIDEGKSASAMVKQLTKARRTA